MQTITQESVYFYTFHKCASTLFADYVLKNLQGLNHVDYATQIYNGEEVEAIEFQRYGVIYGPIRLSVNPHSPVYKRFVSVAAEPEFVKDKLAIFFVRDPRDMLVSLYYSFGFTHGFSSVPEIREQQAKLRREIQTQTLDEYVIAGAGQVAGYFSQLQELSRACTRGTLLRYEDLVEDFDKFIECFTSVVTLDQAVIDQIYQQSRPNQVEDTTSHRRSGQAANYQDKLKESTVAILNQQLAGVLASFGYTP
ncbi:MAG TPA: sulfotransferase domain-containing protein [Pirellulaceae bacterium]|mgnify:FL=1|nr:sulfotransferase domain-containing protein [Pirellulaceae bacterium]HMP69028.1 sulfotransferase domain-containing protein [Pirellulaceae bacterium]